MGGGVGTPYISHVSALPETSKATCISNLSLNNLK